MVKHQFKWPEVIRPQLKTVQARRTYLDKPRVRRWLRRNAPGLRVLDIRHFCCTDPTVIEFTEVYHQILKGNRKMIRVKIVCSDPPPLPVRA